jgi:hypothetical protein
MVVISKSFCHPLFCSYSKEASKSDILTVLQEGYSKSKEADFPSYVFQNWETFKDTIRFIYEYLMIEGEDYSFLEGVEVEYGGLKLFVWGVHNKHNPHDFTRLFN